MKYKNYLALALLLCALIAVPVFAQTQTREQLIVQLQTLIAQLTAQLNALIQKQQPSSAPSLAVSPTPSVGSGIGVLSFSGPDNVVVGQPFTLSYTSSGCASLHLQSGWANGSSVSGRPNLPAGNGSYPVTLTQGGNYLYDLSCYDSAGHPVTGPNSSKRVYVSANVAPPPTSPVPYSLDTFAQNGSVSRSPNWGNHWSGTTVILTPQPNSGYRFSHWSGAASGSQNPLAVVMDRHKIITANFVIFTPPPPPPPPPTTQPTITVLSPNGGNYKIGDPLVVSWSSSNLVTNAKAGALFFHLSDANGTLSSLCLLGSAPKTQTGSVTFTLPSTICADLHPLATGNYKIHVFAEDLTHSSEWIADDFSNNYFTITSAIDGPVSPTNIAASDGTSASGIVVTWTRSTDDPGSGTNFYYKVWRSTSQNATYNPIFVIYSPQAPSFTDTTVAAGTTYWYKVSAGSIVNNRGTDGPLVGPDSGYRAGETTPDTTPPTTAITAPTGGQTVSGTLTISATASDPVVTGQTTSGVTKVEFYRGATLLGTDTASPFTYSWDTTTAVNGNYTLQTKAFDGAGNVGSSATVSVTVNNTVTDTTPDSFSFTDQANVALNTVITSNIVTITGLNVSASVSITGGSYSINGGTHTTAAGTIANNQTVAVRHNSSANYSAAVHTTLTIGGVSGTFTSTTQTSPSQTGVPVPPTNVSASDGSSTGGIVVTWTRSIDDPGQGLDFYYKVWRSTSQNGTYNPIFVIYSPQAPSHTDTTVSAGTTYWYKVSAGRIVNNRGTDGPSAGPDSGYRAGTTSNASILSQIANILQGLQSLLNNLR